MMRPGRCGSVLAPGLLLASACTSLAPDLAAKLDSAKALVRTDDKNKFGEAERLLDEVLAAAPEHEDAIFWKAQMLMAWSDALLEESVNLAKAETKLAALLTRARSREQEITTPEVKELARGVSERVATMHQRVATDLATWQEQAASLQKRGLALIAAKIANEPNPPYEAHRVLADYFRINGNYELARKELDIVRALHPNSAGLRFVEGVMQMLVDNDLDAALRSMEAALVVDADFVKALYYKGLVLARQGDAAAAEKVMGAVLAKSPGHQGAETFLAVAASLRAADEELNRTPAAEP